jgi:anti-sigma B factor antagonist
MQCGIEANLNAEYLDEFREHIERLAAAREDVVLDLSGVNFVDSCGVGALVLLHKRLIANGHRLKVSGLRGQPLQLFMNLKLIPILSAERA